MIFFSFWKACDNPIELMKIANDRELYQLCFETLNSYPLMKYVGLPTAEYKKLTELEREQIEMHERIFAIVAIGYLEKNPIAIKFAEDLKKRSKHSDKSKILLQVWNETLNSFQKEKAATEAKKIINTQSILPYFIALLKKQKYLNDVKSQHILTIISSNPELLKKEKAFEQNKESIINLIELQFMFLPKDPENIHDARWRGQQVFVLLHQYCSSPKRHSDWLKKIIKMEILPLKLKNNLLKNKALYESKE